MMFTIATLGFWLLLLLATFPFPAEWSLAATALCTWLSPPPLSPDSGFSAFVLSLLYLSLGFWATSSGIFILVKCAAGQDGFLCLLLSSDICSME